MDFSAKSTTPTAFAKEIDATKQEVHRNFMRLEKSSLIRKNVNGTFSLTTFGQTVCTQVPSLVFLSQNRKYFERHTFGEIPHKFQMRCGQLAHAQYVKGVSKVLEQWKSIYKNSNEYVYEVLSEVPLDLIEPCGQKGEERREIQLYFLRVSCCSKREKSTTQGIRI